MTLALLPSKFAWTRVGVQPEYSHKDGSKALNPYTFMLSLVLLDAVVVPMYWNWILHIWLHLVVVFCIAART